MGFDSEARDLVDKMYLTLCAALADLNWEDLRAMQAGMATSSTMVT